MTEPPVHGSLDERGASRPAQREMPQQEIELEDLLRRRMPTRRRVLQGLGLALMLVVLAAVIGRTVLQENRPSRAVVPTPTPIPLGPVLVLSNISFGTVTLNRRQLGTPPFVTAFQRGMNTFVLTAPPFLPRSCRVQWPNNLWEGACDVGGGGNPNDRLGGTPRTYAAVVDLWLSGADLPPASLARTLGTFNATLGAVPLRSTVPPGEYVATGLDSRGRIISQQVAAAGTTELIPTTTDLNYTGDVFCAGPGCAPLTAHSTQWTVDAAVSIQWRYTPLTIGDTAHTSHAYDAWTLRSVLTNDAQGLWQIDQPATEHLNGFGLAPALQGMVCRAGSNYITNLRTSEQFNFSAVSDGGLEGCVLQFSPQSGIKVGTFIWRFGVLLAADPQAHVVLPDIPLAPASALTALGLPVPTGW